MTKIDFKKELKHLYNPSVKKVEIVEVPIMERLDLSTHVGKPFLLFSLACLVSTVAGSCSLFLGTDE